MLPFSGFSSEVALPRHYPWGCRGWGQSIIPIIQAQPVTQGPFFMPRQVLGLLIKTGCCTVSDQESRQNLDPSESSQRVPLGTRADSQELSFCLLQQLPLVNSITFKEQQRSTDPATNQNAAKKLIE